MKGQDCQAGIIKKYPILFCLQETHIKYKDRTMIKAKERIEKQILWKY